MKWLASCCLCFLTAGCATVYNPSRDIYDFTPETIATVDKDKSDCALYAANYKRPFNANGIAVSGATGLSSNLGLGGATGNSFSWLGPILGGVGGIVQSVLQYAGVVDVDTPRAYQSCLWQRFDRDHAAILVEPPL